MEISSTSLQQLNTVVFHHIHIFCKYENLEIVTGTSTMFLS